MDDILNCQLIALNCPRGAHRLEAFGLKSDRGIRYRQSALKQWVIPEPDLTVTAFCERPGFIQSGGSR